MTVTQGARERILAASYDLFVARGVRDVGIDEISADAAVATATLYRHFPSKDNLAIAFLQRREAEWTHGVVEAGMMARADDPRAGCWPSSTSSTTGSGPMTMRRARSSA